MRFSAAARTLRPSTPCWTLGRSSRRQWIGRWRRPAGVTRETGERGLRLLGVKAGDTLFIDGGAGGVGAVAVQMAVARGARVIASAGEVNHDYLREIGAVPVLYGEGVGGRVRAAAGGRVDAVFDVAGKTPVEELVSLVSEPSQVVSIANFATGHPRSGLTGRGWPVAARTVGPWRRWRRSPSCWRRTSW